MKGLLRDVGAKQLNGALKEKGLVLVRETKFNNATMYLELLSKTAGTFMLGGNVDGHLHWAGLDCFRGETGETGYFLVETIIFIRFQAPDLRNPLFS